MKKEYYIIPKDVIAFNEVIVEGLKSIEIVGDVEVTKKVTGQKTISDELLIEFSKGDYSAKLSLVPITKEQIDIMRKHHISLNEYQVLIKVIIEFDFDNPLKYLDFESILRKYVILSFILANKKLNICHYEYGEFSKTETDGQGIFLPLSFINLTNEGYVNLYYESSYEKMIHPHSYCRFEESQISEMKRILKLFLIDEKRNIYEPNEEMFIHINTISWIVSGFFYPALVTLFTCFESLLNKQRGQQIADLLSLSSGTSEYDLFLDLQKFRNGIAHLESHEIFRDKSNYICKKIKNDAGNTLSTPVITTFDIDKLESVRVKLVELIIKKIEE